MKSPSRLLAGYFAFSSASLSAQVAITPGQAINFDSFEDGTSTDLEASTTVTVSQTQPLGSFTKFDSSLGTLTEVRLTAEIRTEVFVQIGSDEVIDESSPFSLFLDDSDSFMETDLVYNAGNGPTGRSVGGEAGGFGSVGDTDLDPSDFSAEGFFFFDSASDEYGGFASGGSVLTSGSIFATDADFLESDFVGTGTVSGLQLISFAEVDPVNLIIDNLASAFIEVSTTTDAGEATLEYGYTPVPEPRPLVAVVGILALAIGVLRRRRISF